MHTSASYWMVLLAAGPLIAAQPPAPPRSVAPAQPKAAGPVLDELALPPPRLAQGSMPANSIVEEAAPPPHEQPSRAIPVPPRPFHEEAAPMPHTQSLPPVHFAMPAAPRDPFLPDVGALHRAIDSLRMEREAMLVEEMDLVTSKDFRTAKNNGASLRMRVAELLAKVAQQKRRVEGGGWRVEGKDNPQSAKINPQPSTLHPPHSTHSSVPTTTQQMDGEGVKNEGKSEGGKDHSPPSTLHPPASTSSVVTDAPVDPLALAQSLFRAGDYTAALNAYRKLDKEDQKLEDRIVIQYMMACCLRKLGKVDEASVLYREAANAPGNDFLMENSQWYLRTMKDRRELEAQLEELRQRRQAVKSRKP